MEIAVSRTGGMAGMTRTWSVRVVDDGDELPDWSALVDACPWDEPAVPTPGADRFVYLVRAGDREARLGEAAVDGPWRRLVDRVRDASRENLGG
ncbi:protealysin inhibitor emfourin [Clavibacter tessellarius]|uniref:protealysin inhibitor emfourin n=1 Tax=Clavibacter tessellarius TaxID=31965 RepID=UPI0032547C27